MVTDDRWEVKVGRNAFTMDLSLLKQWVREGRVEAADQVRPLDGDWVNAGDCPPLVPHFKIHQLRLMRTTDEFAESSPKKITADFGATTTGDLESPTRTTGDLLAEAMDRAGTGTYATTGDLFEDEGAKTTGDLFKEGTRVTGEFASPTESLSVSAPTRPITREFATPVPDETPIQAPKPVRRSAARPKPPATAPLPPVEQPAHWLEHPLTPLVSLFIFFPAGLVFLWNNRFFPIREKWTLTGVTFLTIGALVLANYLAKPFDPIAERLKAQAILAPPPTSTQ
jgi:hypothetical protein